MNISSKKIPKLLAYLAGFPADEASLLPRDETNLFFSNDHVFIDRPAVGKNSRLFLQQASNHAA